MINNGRQWLTIIINKDEKGLAMINNDEQWSTTMNKNKQLLYKWLTRMNKDEQGVTSRHGVTSLNRAARDWRGRST